MPAGHEGGVFLDLARTVIESGARSVAIVGTAKNVGKTVTLNYLIGEISSRAYTLGVLSSGRDGELVDALTGEPKPQVYLPAGSWVATAEAFLESTSVSLEVVDVWERPGVFGRVVLGRVVEPGLAELAGPRSARQLSSAIKKLLAYGADLVLVDGALDRKAAASPLVTEACIFATGASSADDVESMAESLRSLVWLWSLPVPGGGALLETCRRTARQERVSYVKRRRVGTGTGEAGAGRLLVMAAAYPTALGYEEEVARGIDENTVALVVPGSVDRTLLQEVSASLARLGSEVTRPFYIVMRDPSCAMFRREHAVAFEKAGGKIGVLEPGRVLAVTVNPCLSAELAYEPRELVRYLGERVRPVPVFDVVSGESFREEVA